MTKILALVNGSGSAYWRIKDPLETLQKAYPDKYDVLILDRLATEDELFMADIIILQSIVDLDTISLCYYFQQKKGTKIICDIDDLVTKMNKDNPHAKEHEASDAKEKIIATLKFADMVTTTTNYLAKKLSVYNKNVVVLPNLMLMSRWNIPTFKNDSEEVRIGWCFPTDTEILTTSGWRNYNNFNILTDMVACYSDGKIEYNDAEDVIFNKGEEVLEVKAEVNNPCFTKEHLVYYSNNGKNYSNRKWGDVLDNVKTNLVFKTAGIFDSVFNGEEINIGEEYARLVAHIVSDGYFFRKNGDICGIGHDVKKVRKAFRFRELLNLCGIKYSTSYRKDRGYTRTRIPMEEYKNKLSKIFSDEKSLKQWMCFLPINERKALLEEYSRADGSTLTDTSFAVRSSVKNNIDILQQIATTVGWRSKITQKKCGKSNSTLYSMTVLKNTDEGTVDMRSNKVSTSKQDVWDVYVGGKNIIVRRNGTVSVTHNCGSVTHMDDLMLVIKPLMDTLLEHPNVKLIFMGETRIRDHFHPLESRVETYLGVPFDSYPQKLHGLRLDIGLAPLGTSFFNKSKSYIKLLEYGICGVPAICSWTEPYKSVMKHEKTGYIVRKNTNWLNYLDILVTNKKLRNKLGKNAYKNTLRYDLAKRIHLWDDAYSSLTQHTLKTT